MKKDRLATYLGKLFGGIFVYIVFTLFVWSSMAFYFKLFT